MKIFCKFCGNDVAVHEDRFTENHVDGEGFDCTGSDVFVSEPSDGDGDESAVLTTAAHAYRYQQMQDALKRIVAWCGPEGRAKFSAQQPAGNNRDYYAFALGSVQSIAELALTPIQEGGSA